MTAVDVPGLDKQNGVTLGRILGRGTVGQAEEGSDGVMRATIRIPEDELVYEPGILVMPHAGTLELTLINDDKNTHCAVLPSNGDYKFMPRSSSTARATTGTAPAPATTRAAA
jgi:PQQ system protein